MVDPQMERVIRHLTRLKLVATRDRLDALLQEAARKEMRFLEFLDLVLSEETAAKESKRIRMGIQIAHFPVVRTLDDFDFSLQTSIDRPPSPAARVGTPGYPGAPLTEPCKCCSHTALRDDGL